MAKGLICCQCLQFDCIDLLWIVFNEKKQPPELLYKISQNPQENTCARVWDLQHLFKKRLWLRCFHVNFVKFFTTPFMQNISGRMLLNEVSLHYCLNKFQLQWRFCPMSLVFLTKSFFVIGSYKLLSFLIKIYTTYHLHWQKDSCHSWCINRTVSAGF